MADASPASKYSQYSYLPDAGSLKHGMAKKDGYGGNYAWESEATFSDYAPIGFQNGPKVTTQPIANHVAIGREPSFRGDVGEEAQFPGLSSQQRTVGSHGWPAKGPSGRPTEQVAEKPSETLKEGIIHKAATIVSKTKEIALAAKTFSIQTARDHKVQVSAATAASGTIFFGFFGGATGLVAGSVLGTAVGIPFAVFTFGMSIPVFAIVGGGLGSTTGAVIGGTSGGAAGGVAGYTVFTYRCQIRQFVNCTWTRVSSIVNDTRSSIRSRGIAAYQLAAKRLSLYKSNVTEHLRNGFAIAQKRTAKAQCALLKTAKHPHAQVTTASAAVGGVTLGVAGGSVGLAAGGIAGAAVGIVPAFFTFGLSIPICGVIGGGAGLCIGTTVGGATGAVGAGAAGYGVYAKKNEILEGVVNIRDGVVCMKKRLNAMILRR